LVAGGVVDAWWPRSGAAPGRAPIWGPMMVRAPRSAEEW